LQQVVQDLPLLLLLLEMQLQMQKLPQLLQTTSSSSTSRVTCP
jgi:hypothetical protein